MFPKKQNLAKIHFSKIKKRKKQKHQKDLLNNLTLHPQSLENLK